jgi:hypothetical protein
MRLAFRGSHGLSLASFIQEYSNRMQTLKIVAATLVVIGIVLGAINIIYAPDHLLLESSPRQPSWLPWLGWGLTSGAAILYIVVDYFQSS